MQATESTHAWWRDARFWAYAVAFVVAVSLGRLTRIAGSELAMVWPAAGVALLWVSWAWSARRTLVVSLVAVGLVSAVGNGLTGAPPLDALALGLANVVHAWVAAAVLARIAPSRRTVLDSPQALGAVAVACLAGALASALVGPLVITRALDLTFLHVAGSWVVRFAVSAFVVTTVGLRLRPSAVLGDFHHHRGRVETAMLSLSLLVAYTTVFGFADGMPLGFLVVPLSVWVGLRYSTSVAALHALVAGTVVVVLTLLGHGPFAALPVDQRGVAAEMMIAVLALVSMVLALKRDQRDSLASQLTSAARKADDQARQLDGVVTSISDGIVVIDGRGKVVLSNPAARRMLTDSSIENSQVGAWTEMYSPLHPDGTPFEVADLPIMRALGGEYVDDVDMLIVAGDGTRQVLSVTARPLTADDHRWIGSNTSGAVAAFRDVTQRRVDADLLVRSERRFRTAFETAPVGMAILDADSGAVRRANEVLAVFVGAGSSVDLVGHALRDRLVPDDQSRLDDALAKLRDGADQVRIELKFGDPELPAWGSVSLALLEPEPGTTRPTVVALIEDVTVNKRAEDALTRQALHDQLTGLANRTLLSQRLDDVISRSSDDRAAAGLMYLDLDGFKAVNDTYGHAAGDELLVEISRRLEALLRGTDTVARLGGDEFAILCPRLTGDDEIDAVASRVLTAVSEPAELSVGRVVVRASVGVVRVLGSSDADTLMRSADEAMYEAKRGGRDRVVSLSGPEQARAARAARLLPELARAIDEGELEMVGQPVVSASTGTVTAVEALVRWRHPTRGLLAPAHFLEVLESSALMGRAWDTILDQSLAHAAEWSRRIDPVPSVHVNVSGRQLATGLCDVVLDALDRHHVDPGRLVLELTESFVPLIHDSIRDEIEELRRHGVRIALDDLGTGYSSLAMLTELPIDVLKIDRRFVSGLGVDPRCEAVVHSIVTLGQRLDMEVVAEGVETQDQHDVLATMQCPSLQGYLYSRPLEQDALRRFLAGSRVTSHLSVASALA